MGLVSGSRVRDRGVCRSAGNEQRRRYSPYRIDWRTAGVLAVCAAISCGFDEPVGNEGAPLDTFPAFPDW